MPPIAEIRAAVLPVCVFTDPKNRECLTSLFPRSAKLSIHNVAYFRRRDDLTCMCKSAACRECLRGGPGWSGNVSAGSVSYVQFRTVESTDSKPPIYRGSADTATSAQSYSMTRIDPAGPFGYVAQGFSSTIRGMRNEAFSYIRFI